MGCGQQKMRGERADIGSLKLREQTRSARIRRLVATRNRSAEIAAHVRDRSTRRATQDRTNLKVSNARAAWEIHAAQRKREALLAHVSRGGFGASFDTANVVSEQMRAVTDALQVERERRSKAARERYERALATEQARRKLKRQPIKRRAAARVMFADAHRQNTAIVGHVQSRHVSVGVDLLERPPVPTCNATTSTVRCVDPPVVKQTVEIQVGKGFCDNTETLEAQKDISVSTVATELSDSPLTVDVAVHCCRPDPGRNCATTQKGPAGTTCFTKLNKPALDHNVAALYDAVLALPHLYGNRSQSLPPCTTPVPRLRRHRAVAISPAPHQPQRGGAAELLSKAFRVFLERKREKCHGSGHSVAEMSKDVKKSDAATTTVSPASQMEQGVQCERIVLFPSPIQKGSIHFVRSNENGSCRCCPDENESMMSSCLSMSSQVDDAWICPGADVEDPTVSSPLSVGIYQSSQSVGGAKIKSTVALDSPVPSSPTSSWLSLPSSQVTNVDTLEEAVARALRLYQR